MTSPAGMAPIDAPRATDDVARDAHRRLLLPILAIVASGAAILMLVRQVDGQTLDYGVGLVPAVVPWASACLSITVAVLSLSERRMASVAGSLLLGALMVVSAWAVVILPLDAARAAGLAPAVNPWGASTRLLLLAGSAFALLAGLSIRRVGQARCGRCGRTLPGPLDRLPRWPIAVGTVFAFVYPLLRLCWALGGTFGTAGEPLVMDAAVAWGVVIAGACLPAVAIVLLVGRGPRWARAVLGLGGVFGGLLLATFGGLGALGVATRLATEGLASVEPDTDLMTWTFLAVYGSWFVAGLGIMVGGWRFWAHRRDTCPACRELLGPS